MDKTDITTRFNELSGPDGWAELASLHPTQITVGRQEVRKKRKRFRTMAATPGKLERYLRRNPVVVVRGPEDALYVIDRHHTALSLFKEGFETAPIRVAHDFSHLSQERFWEKMKAMTLLHLRDQNGTLRALEKLPGNLDGMKDDPYRSLAWFARKAGGFEKVSTPYAEFEWADYFRARIEKELVGSDFAEARRKAAQLAKDPAAEKLPGYVGMTPEETAQAAEDARRAARPEKTPAGKPRAALAHP
jgi:hypothetical protein